jgi:hypothetical protein
MFDQLVGDIGKLVFIHLFGVFKLMHVQSNFCALLLSRGLEKQLRQFELIPSIVLVEL